MATVKVLLITGLTIGEIVHKLAEIREVTAGDLIDATEESERLVCTEEGEHILVASPTMVGLNTLRRQIVKIGDHKGPLTLGEIKKLSAADLNALQAQAQQLDQATLRGIENAGKPPSGTGEST